MCKQFYYDATKCSSRNGCKFDHWKKEEPTTKLMYQVLYAIGASRDCGTLPCLPFVHILILLLAGFHSRNFASDSGYKESMINISFAPLESPSTSHLDSDWRQSERLSLSLEMLIFGHIVKGWGRGMFGR